MNDLELALKKHHYVFEPGGKPGVNVTAIAGLIDDGKSSMMSGAAAKITREGGNHRQEWDAKRDLGTRVHDYCASLLAAEAFDYLPSDLSYVNAMEKFIVDHDPEAIEVEQIVVSHLGYGGRFDMIVDLGPLGGIGLFDVKTGKPYAVEHTLQLSAYRHADGIAVYDEAGMLTGVRPLPDITRTGCLYLFEDGSYKLEEYPADEVAFESFKALLQAYQWTRSDFMKAAVKASKAPR